MTGSGWRWLILFRQKGCRISIWQSSKIEHLLENALQWFCAGQRHLVR